LELLILTDARREMLLKWKKEKELKKKIEVAEQAKKKPFRVVHIDTEIFPFQNLSQPVKVCSLYADSFCHFIYFVIF